MTPNKLFNVAIKVTILTKILLIVCVAFSMSARSPWSAHSTGSALAEGAGPRGVCGAARDEKLVPDIYLTIPGSSDWTRAEAFTADTQKSMTCL